MAGDLSDGRSSAAAGLPVCDSCKLGMGAAVELKNVSMEAMRMGL